jgi:hypothetical protein
LRWLPLLLKETSLFQRFRTFDEGQAAGESRQGFATALKDLGHDVDWDISPSRTAMQVTIAGGPLILRHPQATERFFALLRMTALKLKPKKRETKRKTKYNHKIGRLAFPGRPYMAHIGD